MDAAQISHHRASDHNIVKMSDDEISIMDMNINRQRREKKPGRRSETYLAEGQRLSHTGSWARNVSSGEVFWSQETFRIFAFVGSRSVLLRRLCVNSLVVKDKE
jgi:hypothetical protein